MTETDLLYTMALQHVPNVGAIIAKRLIHHCGSAEAVLKEKKQNLKKIDGIGSVILGDMYNPHHLMEAEKEIEYIKTNEIKVSYFKEDGYPETLKHCIYDPILFFYSVPMTLSYQRLI